MRFNRSSFYLFFVSEKKIETLPHPSPYYVVTNEFELSARGMWLELPKKKKEERL